MTDDLPPSKFFSGDSSNREAIVSAFEEAWFRGENPTLADYLVGQAAGRRELLVELIHVDIEFRLKRGERTRVESYLSRFPEIGHDRKVVCELISAEYDIRRRTEPELSAEELYRRFPDLRSELERRLGSEVTPPSAVIRVVAGPHAGAAYRFTQHESKVVGRAADADLRLLQDPHFSRLHFRLEVNPPDAYLVDLDSHNGTFVNGTRIRTHSLKHGDVISGGRTQIAFTVEETPPRDDAPAVPAIVASPRIPGYELQDELGRGSMGVVYRAVQKSTAETVALKVVLPAHQSQHDATLLFIREAHVLSRLDHPAIVRLFEVGVADGNPWLAMEYVPTISYKQVLDVRPGLPRMGVACGIVCRVLDALHHAHSLSLVHRDIKPSNILLTQAGGELTVKLVDFGLAKNYMATGMSHITQEGDIRGTLAFMPPEQIRDCRFAKPACDLYGLGVTLYYYLSGRIPFEFSAGRSTFATILNKSPIPLRTFCSDLPAELLLAVDTSIAKDPADRFRTASEMQRALQPFLRS